MAVGQDCGLYAVCANAEIPVFTIRLGPASLKRSAVYQVTFSINLKYMFGTCYFLGCAE